MKQQNRLNTTSQEETASVNEHETRNKPGLEFRSPEEMLRHDALHTPVPPEIAHRLQQSAGQLPPLPARSWWRRFFGSHS